MPKKIVTSLDGMTAEWFTALLREAGVLGGGRVESVSLNPVGGGLIANMVRATLTYSDAGDAPASVVVKYPSDDKGSFGLAQAMGMYELEIRFYQDVAPHLPRMSIPKCYSAQFDEQTCRFTLVLEDRGANTRPGDVLRAATLDECAAVFGELVNFQAPLWNSRAVAELGWLADPRRTLGVFDSLPAGLAPFLERFGHALDPAHVKLFELVLPQAGKWVRSWQAPTVVQHGDFRSDNILFGVTAEAPRATVIDFQTIRLGPPGVDAAYFMGSSLPTDARRKVERELIADYHQRLVAADVEHFDWNACWASYREGAMYAVYLFVGMASQVVSTERGDRVIVDQIRRYADMAVDLEAPQAAGLA